MHLLENGVVAAVFLVVVLAVVFVLLRRSRRYFGHGARDERPLVHVSRQTFEPQRGQERIADLVARAEVQLHDQTREAFGKLDSKISALGYLTGTAQQQIQRLQVLIERADAVAHRPSDGVQNTSLNSPQ
jgi:hypothetical protein